MGVGSLLGNRHSSGASAGSRPVSIVVLLSSVKNRGGQKECKNPAQNDTLS